MDIRSATVEDIESIAALATQGFIKDPVMAEYVKRTRDPEKALDDFFMIELKEFYIPKGIVDVAEVEGKILGVALWCDPDVPMTKADELRMVPGMVRTLGRSFPRVRVLGSYDGAATPKFRHWYLYTVAVDPAAQGQGIGAALLDHGIARAGDTPIYLESTTPGSRRLYERKGFIALGVVPSIHPAPQVGMWRPGSVETN